MTERPRSKAGLLRLATIAGCALTLAFPVVASADALLYNFDMYTDRVNTYGGPRTVNKVPQYYRWLDRPPTSSRISMNTCANFSSYLYNDFGQTTSYYKIDSFIGGSDRSFPQGSCMYIRGRSLGTINFFNHDGSAIY